MLPRIISRWIWVNATTLFVVRSCPTNARGRRATEFFVAALTQPATISSPTRAPPASDTPLSSIALSAIRADKSAIESFVEEYGV